jgi:hypothetical protein
MTFANAVVNQSTRTENGMKARASSSNACVDLFYNIGASRGKNIVPQFAAAYAENKVLAARIALWSRDVRGGAGERQIFRDLINYLERIDPKLAKALISKAPMLGRWDDVLCAKTDEVKQHAFAMVKVALAKADGLCAKWMPRKGAMAVELRKYLGMSPKGYRKTLVSATNVVETQMCEKNWDGINFSHVPSMAAARYRAAFMRNTPKYQEYVESLVRGDVGVKANAAAIYPHEVIKAVNFSTYGGVQNNLSVTERNFIVSQWNALPNYINDFNVLPMIDVSGSMCCPAGGSKSVTCMQVAIALGLYCADKNTGVFRDTFLTFSESPVLQHVYGDIVAKIDQTSNSHWGMSTNLHKAVDKILSVAIDGKVSNEDMPKMLLVLSDMQFDRCTSFDDTAMQMFERKYLAAGYSMPKIVFWNLNAYNNVPVKSTESGVALVSGFSPAIMTALLSGNLEEFSPESIMLKTVMSERYDFLT